MSGGITATTVIAITTAVVATASAGFAAYSAVQQSNYQKDMGKYQSAVYKNNASYAESAAKDAEARGQADALKRRQIGNQMVGSQQAALAGNGVDVAGDSSIGLYNDTFNATEEDSMTISQNAAREATGYRQQAGNFNSQAMAAQAASDGENPYLAGGSALFAGVGNVADKWYKADQVGAFSSAPISPTPSYTGGVQRSSSIGF